MEAFLKLHYFSDEQPSERVVSMNFFKAAMNNQAIESPILQQLVREKRFNTLTGVAFDGDCGAIDESFSVLHGGADEQAIDRHAVLISDQAARKCFMLQATLLNSSISQISKVQLTDQVERDIEANEFTQDLASQIYRFYCYSLLLEYKLEEHAEAIFTAIQQFLAYLSSYEPTADTLPVLLCTNFVCFPYNIIKFAMFRGFTVVGKLESAYNLIKSVPNLRSETIQTLALMGKVHRETALELVEAQLAREDQTRVERSDFVMLKGEILDDKTYFEEALQLYERNARAQRDLGLHYLTAFKQQKLSAEEQKTIVKKAIEHLTKGWSLKPSDRVCRENLGQLLLITRTGLRMCLEIFESLDSDFPHEPSYLKNIAMTHYALGDKPQSMEYFMQSLKCDNQTSVETALKALRLAAELEPHQRTVFNAHFLLSQLINRFNLYFAKHKFESDKQQCTYAMNFIWQINESVIIMANWLIDQVAREANPESRKRQVVPLKQLIECYLDLMRRFAATEAGEECMLNYTRMMDRIGHLEK